VKGDPYILYITEPEGYQHQSLDVQGARLEKTGREGRLLRLALLPDGDGEISWSITFK
jgi:hypothetical protein